MRATRARRLVKMALTFGTVLGVAVWAVPRAAAAEASDRGMHWQMSIPLTFTSGASYDSENGSSFDVNDDLGWGFGFGYNLNNKFMVGVDWTWLSANYSAHIPLDLDGDGIADDSTDIGGTLDASNLQFVGQYNILPGHFTPFVKGSLGWTWIDSNIPSGPTQGVCWWDPWWGYVCDAWQPTFEDTSFAYGLSAGVRAELAAGKFFVEGSYNILWLDFDKAGTQDVDGFRVNFGWTF